MKHSIVHSRFCHWILCFLFLVMAAGMLAVPVRLLGQESAPAATSAPGANAPPLAAVSKAGDKETEAEDDNVYRHAPIVQSIAKKFNLSVETTARFFEFINFAILVLAIGIPLVKVLPKVLRKRSETLSHNIESARKMTQDANTRLSAVEAKLSKLGDEIADIRAHVEEESKQDEVRIKAAIDGESRRIVASAEQEITLAAAQARRGLQNFAAELAIERAVRQMELTPETDRALIAEFMREASTSAGNGGKN